MIWLWILALVAQSADAGYTCHRLSQGAREVNAVLPQSCAGIVAIKSAAIITVPFWPASKQKWALTALTIYGGVGVGVSMAWQ